MFTHGKNCVLKLPDKCDIHDSVVIGDNVHIEVTKRLVIGKKSWIKDGSVIKGVDIELGREFYTMKKAEIGGGSSFEKGSKLKVGYWCHLGRDTFINTSRYVEIGNEVGMKGYIYTHGAYLNVLDGFPIQWGEVHIGDNVWMPEVTVHPNVTIGSNSVIGGGSIVTRDIPSGSYAVGRPCKVVDIRYPKKLELSEIDQMIKDILKLYDYTLSVEGGIIHVGSTTFDCVNKTAEGMANADTEHLRNRLRRHGIRFKVDVDSDVYTVWND